jgi:hypothetical protein
LYGGKLPFHEFVGKVLRMYARQTWTVFAMSTALTLALAGRNMHFNLQFNLPIYLPKL